MTTPGRQPIPADQQELLSAYLDNQLGGVERAALERKLAGDAALRAELDELRTVRQMLRDLPALTPPRSFTLSSAQVRPRSLPLFGWLRASSAVAALLLVLTFLPSVLPGGGSSAPSAAMVPTQAAAVESGAAQDSARVAEVTTAPAAPAEAQAPGAEPPSVGAPAPSVLQATAPNSAAEAATAMPATAAAAAAEPTAAAASAGGAAASEPTTPSIAIEAPPISTRTAMTSGTDVIAASNSSSPGTISAEKQQPVPGQPLPPLLWAQIALAALAVALGIAALLARRAGR